MLPVHTARDFDFSDVPVDPHWNPDNGQEQKIHRIHAYPAKFPAFITTQALRLSAKPARIADIFCGCGTTAFEAKRNNIDFWGCDINPVATLIARTKSRQYQISKLQDYYAKILNAYTSEGIINYFESAPERLQYWYPSEQYNALAHLKYIIKTTIPDDSDYKLFFLCGFSNILKSTSRWLTRSIKPQIDPDKQPVQILDAFKTQYAFMYASVKDLGDSLGEARSEIMTGNFLDVDAEKIPPIDMIITSPPYVTSYEYADLHQLSSLWLDYTKNYKSLRKGTIGSSHHEYNFDALLKKLNTTGMEIVTQLLKQYKAKSKSVAKYFLDMQHVAQKSFDILNPGGSALFVIGNTEYKKVKINNARHLAESLQNAGFTQLHVTKRKIKNKILTPYRNQYGRFTSTDTGRRIYHEEYIIIGNKAS